MHRVFIYLLPESEESGVMEGITDGHDQYGRGDSRRPATYVRDRRNKRRSDGRPGVHAEGRRTVGHRHAAVRQSDHGRVRGGWGRRRGRTTGESRRSPGDRRDSGGVRSSKGGFTRPGRKHHDGRADAGWRGHGRDGGRHRFGAGWGGCAGAGADGAGTQRRTSRRRREAESGGARGRNAHSPAGNRDSGDGGCGQRTRLSQADRRLSRRRAARSWSPETTRRPGRSGTATGIR